MKIKFIEITRQAAELERKKSFQQAGELWHQALLVARRDANTEYCRRRADFCLSSMFTRSSQVC
ncbi:ANR family transcriptional regulator [Salmonella enterica]|nr:ANR family transcriptional regulator [Salmonella enterica]EJN1667657.1 ANR family transcriptional regulator [Salmonella enterica]EKJ5690646.1 ANR family transcriptional regulator [Salmonella enterica]